jgi:hypothetical protein
VRKPTDVQCKCAEACCGLNCPAPEAEAEAEVRRSNDYELSDTSTQVSTPGTSPLTSEPDEEHPMVALVADHIHDNKRDNAMTTTTAASPSLSLEPRIPCPQWCGAIIELVCTNYWVRIPLLALRPPQSLTTEQGMWDYCVDECEYSALLCIE